MGIKCAHACTTLVTMSTLSINASYGHYIPASQMSRARDLEEVICPLKILFVDFMTLFVLRKCVSSFQDLKLLKEETALTHLPWDSAASKFHPHLGRQREFEWEDVDPYCQQGPGDTSLMIILKGLGDPPEKRQLTISSYV